MAACCLETSGWLITMCASADLPISQRRPGPLSPIDERSSPSRVTSTRAIGGAKGQGRRSFHIVGV
eukprot:scaffold60180_cov30-Tisochrysis_lutea.AAC.6